ncbi:Hypothetical protein NGAL_HAMBI1146_58490 [Neorhizobium galegae bv. officinalis]|nr:Hypothetical protein NGAL_HAMBI1146_58490 [Neorhizobium galegae bv. officinalis]
MKQPISLVIVTDNPKKAAPAIFGMHLECLPGWVLVLSDHRQIEQLEEGAPCMAVWFPVGKSTSIQESTWMMRRQAVRLDDDFGRHQARVFDWLAKRQAAEKAICDQVIAEEREREAIIPPDAAILAHAANHAQKGTVNKFPATTKWS